LSFGKMLQSIHTSMKFPLLSPLAAFALVIQAIVAQEPVRGPDANPSHHVPGVVLLTIPGKPFSAKTSTDWTRTLADGSTITLHLDAFLARDSQGRVYRENHQFVPVGSKFKAPLYEIHLYDPVARVQLYCYGRTFRCEMTDYTPETFYTPPQEGAYDHGARTLAREHLGSDTIEGIYVTGTRETTTIQPGTVGNEHAMVSTREFWYSDELETNLAVTRIDPIEGRQVIRLSEIKRGDPDSHLWDVPIGFTVRDLRRLVRQTH